MSASMSASMSAYRDLVAFVQFKKREKNPMEEY